MMDGKRYFEITVDDAPANFWSGGLIMHRARTAAVSAGDVLHFLHFVVSGRAYYAFWTTNARRS